MKFSSEQVNRIEAMMQPRYYELLRKYLRQNSGPAVAHLDDATLLKLISVVVPKAQAFGIQSGAAILLYVNLAIMRGPFFGDQPKMRKFLQSAKGTPDQKVHWIYDRIMRKLWDAMPPSTRRA